MRILIVDDKREELQLLGAIMKKGGYEVTTAQNGEEALKKLNSEKIDLVLSDILMPVMDGFQLCRQIRKEKKFKNIPFVFCTATYLDERDEELAMKIGADRFLRKPIEPKDLLAIIQEVFQEAKIREEKEIKEEEKEEEKEVLQLYNERLVEKLEKKVFELEKLKSRYQTLCENIHDFVYSLNEEGYFVDANCRAEMFGYKPEDVIGKHFTDYLTPESRKIALKHFASAKKGESSHDIYEVQVVKKDGGIADVELSVSTIYKEGKYIGRFGIARDITERKKMEEELRERETRYREIVEYSKALLCTHDLAGKILSLNEWAARILGIPRDKLLGMNIQDILAPEVRHEFPAYLATIRKEKSA